MPERISALIDGEFEEADLSRELSRLKGDPVTRETWDTYHLIGDALRGHFGANLCTAVAGRLKAEPTVLAPNRATKAASTVAWYALSAAASLAAVALVAWMALSSDRQDAAPQLAAGSAAVGVAKSPLAVQRGASQLAQKSPAAMIQPAPDASKSREVENYLLAHQRFSPSNAMQGVAPYVRLVADEREDAAP